MKKELLFGGVLKLCLLVFLFLSFDIGLHAQGTITVQGVVKDKTGEPLIGVTVSEKGTTNGSLTDLDGNYSLTVRTNSTIVFTYIGYTTIEMVANKSTIDITLTEDSQILEDVVVIGYGVQKKVNLTGSVATVDGSAIAAKASSDAVSALQGEMPGVAITRTGGQPGMENAGIQIRGVSSVNDAKALVLIDGVEGDLALINPNDIANISVLKDAAASAIYGARAAAGVVLVTTKSGSEGKTHISYSGSFTINVPGLMPKRLPAWEEQEFINESRRQTSGAPEWNPELSSWVANPNFNYRPNNSNGRWDLFEATNWVDEGTRDHTTQQSHSVSITGGSKDINYLVSLGYFNKKGILKYGPDKNERYNVRLKLNAALNKYMDLAVNASYSGQFTESNPFNVDPKKDRNPSQQSADNTGATRLLERLYSVRGRQPIYNPVEDVRYAINPYNGDLQVNPIDLMKNGGDAQTNNESYVGKGELTIKDLVDGLRLKLSASRQSNYFSNVAKKREIIWYDRIGTGPRMSANSPNSLTKQKFQDYHNYFEALAYYDLKLDKHSFNFLAGATYEDYRLDLVTATARNLNSNDFFSFNVYDSSVATNSELSDLIQTWGMMSYFGRINYNFSDRYLLEANIRYDGSSRLAPDKRWKAFPSFSAAWRINEESWFNIPYIDNLKLRGSWGQLGMGANVGFYDYMKLLEAGTLMGDRYFYQKTMASVDKTWEILQSTNVGFDLNMLSNRLSLTADYFWKRNNDMLIDYNLPDLVGINPPKGNLGELKTWGWELQLGWRDQIGPVKYQVSANVSDAKNELVKYNGTNVVAEGNVPYLEGYPINTIWGYKTDGFWSSKEEYQAYKTANPGYKSFNDGNVSGGDIRYVAQGSADHEIGMGKSTPENPGDLVILGDANPRYFYGFTLAAQWNNFDFSMMWQGVGKRKILVETATIAPLAVTSIMPWTIHRDYWTQDNQNAYWPRLYNYNGGDPFNYKPSDKWIQDASYIRLKNIQVGYTVPIKNKIIDRLRVYFSGDDVWEHTNLLEVFDPEVKNNASANYYPFFRSWTMGINLTF